MFIVLEIQKNATVSTIVNAYEDVNTAEQQYRTILAAAAVSALPVHAAVMMRETGQVIKHEFYTHEQEGEE